MLVRGQKLVWAIIFLVTIVVCIFGSSIYSSLVSATNGTLKPEQYTLLALTRPSAVAAGFQRTDLVGVRMDNQTEHKKAFA